MVAPALLEQGVSELAATSPEDILPILERLGRLARLCDLCGEVLGPELQSRVPRPRLPEPIHVEGVVDAVWQDLASSVPDVGEPETALLLQRDRAESLVAGLLSVVPWDTSAVVELTRYLGAIDEEFDTSILSVWAWCEEWERRSGGVLPPMDVTHEALWIAYGSTEMHWWSRGMMAGWLASGSWLPHSAQRRRAVPAEDTDGKARPKAHSVEGLWSRELIECAAMLLDPPWMYLRRLPFDVQTRVLSAAYTLGRKPKVDVLPGTVGAKAWPWIRVTERDPWCMEGRDVSVTLTGGNTDRGVTVFDVRSPEWRPRMALVLRPGTCLLPLERAGRTTTFPEVYPEQCLALLLEQRWEGDAAAVAMEESQATSTPAKRLTPSRVVASARQVGNEIHATGTMDLVMQYESAAAAGGREEWEFAPIEVAGHELRISSAVAEDRTLPNARTRMIVEDVQNKAQAISVHLVTQSGQTVAPKNEPPEGFPPRTPLVFERYVSKEELRGLAVRIAIAVTNVWELVLEAVAQAVPSPLFGQPLPVAATGGPTEWPDIEFGLQGLSFALVGGESDPVSGVTRFELQQMEGDPFPVPRLGLALMVGGEVVLPRNPPAAGYEPGGEERIEFESIVPRSVESVVFAMMGRPAEDDSAG